MSASDKEQPPAETLCDYCRKVLVPAPYTTCWLCRSYLEYRNAPRCDCPHDPNCWCRCEPECEEDCPADEYEARYPGEED